MSLTKDFFNRKTNITAKVICDSISVTGQRITTFEIEYPRFILAELNTHKMLEKNSSSSRAIPIGKMIEQIRANAALPIYWGSKKAGMQAGVEVKDVQYSIGVWMKALAGSIGQVELLDGEGVHKQTVNRLLEPFQMMKTVITGTDWDNFFNLRIHPDAQPEFCMLAYKMYQAMQESVPTLLLAGEWHLPYVKSCYDIDPETRAKIGPLDYYIGEVGTSSFKYITLEEAQRISASCCAQTSYRKHDESLEKADSMFQMLVGANVLHASPFGHLATPIVSVNDPVNEVYKNLTDEFTWELGVTHMRRNGVLCSGNLTGWISYRHLLPKNTCYDFNFEERMKLF